MAESATTALRQGSIETRLLANNGDAKLALQFHFRARLSRCTLQRFDGANSMAIMLASQSRKQLSHERIVAGASRAIRRAGYQGVSVLDIMKEAGLTHGGFYAHFESRDAMPVEAMQYAVRGMAIPVTGKRNGSVALAQGDFAAFVQSILTTGNRQTWRMVASCWRLRPRRRVKRALFWDEARWRVSALIDAVLRAMPRGADQARRSRWRPRWWGRCS